MKWLALLCILAIGSGCSHSYKLDRSGGIAAAPRLDRTGSLFIGMPADGMLGSKTYGGSGNTTVEYLTTAFTGYAARVERARQVTPDKDAGLQSAARGGFTYFVYPTILHWEDRATEWSGKSDRVRVRIEIFEVRDRNLLDSVTLSGKSKWATFGGDRPEDLLLPPMREYVAELYGGESDR